MLTTASVTDLYPGFHSDLEELLNSTGDPDSPLFSPTYDALRERVSDLVDQIRAIPARSTGEILLKIKVSHWYIVRSLQELEAVHAGEGVNDELDDVSDAAALIATIRDDLRRLTA